MEKIRGGVESVRQMYYRLLVVKTGDSNKDSRYIAKGLNIQRINIGEKLGRELLEIPAKRRPLKVAEVLEVLLDDVGGDGALLDHIEILFEESLSVDPLTLLRSVSRRHLVVVMWSGEVEAGNLVYGVPGHHEYRSYPTREVTLVQSS